MRSSRVAVLMVSVLLVVLLPLAKADAYHEIVLKPILSPNYGPVFANLPPLVQAAIKRSQGEVVVAAVTWFGPHMAKGNGVLVDERYVLVPATLISPYREVAYGKSTVYAFNGYPARFVGGSLSAGLAVLELSSSVQGMRPVEFIEKRELKKYEGAAFLDIRKGDILPIRIEVTEADREVLVPETIPDGGAGTPLWSEGGKLAGVVVLSSGKAGVVGADVTKGFLQWLKGDRSGLPEFSAADANIVAEQSSVFGEILWLYAMKSLVKPANLLLCAQEMLRMKPNEKSCRDRYSMYVPAAEAEIESASRRTGQFGGVGLEVGVKGDTVVVIAPIEGTPAYRAGILSGDEIVNVDGVIVLDVGDAVRRIRGKVGTKVLITVRRSNGEKTFELVREKIVIRAVETSVVGPAIGYLRVKTFSEVMPGEFNAAMEKFRREGILKVILDFRNNSGGLLHIADEVLYGFARPNNTVIVMKERVEEIVHDTKYVREFSVLAFKKDPGEPGEFRDFKVVVLINGGSASASEIFAGTMKDWGYPVVGVKSFGKGVGQTVFPLSDKSELSLTTFEFFVGDSRVKINGVGVAPTHEVRDAVLSSSEILREDRQREKAIELLLRD